MPHFLGTKDLVFLKSCSHVVELASFDEVMLPGGLLLIGWNGVEN